MRKYEQGGHGKRQKPQQLALTANRRFVPSILILGDFMDTAKKPVKDQKPCTCGGCGKCKDCPHKKK